jgi:hypothetical protein
MTARKTATLPAHRASAATSSSLRRLVEISGAVATYYVRENGPTDLLFRLSDPFWFQAFGAVLGCNWMSPSVTPTVCAALKEAARKQGRDLGIVVCGGKGVTSRKAPEEIRRACDRTGDQAEPLIYASRLASKIDSACIQDGFELSHHTFIFVPGCGAWAIVQQGMAGGRKFARRYHWNSMRLPSFVSDPHTAIASDRRVSGLNLVASEGMKHRQAITALTREHPDRVMREVELYLHGPRLPVFASNGNGKNGKNGKHVKKGAGSPKARVRDLNPAAIKKVLLKTFQSQACDFEELLGDHNVTAESLMSLSLLAEAIYQAPPSRRDPAGHSFAQGTRDSQPYATQRTLYDRHLDRLRSAVESARIADNDRARALRGLAEFTARLTQVTKVESAPLRAKR